MHINSISNSYTFNYEKNKTTARKAVFKQTAYKNTNRLNLNNLSFYPVSFGAKSSKEKLAYIGSENFPNREILKQYQETIDDNNILLCEIHKNFYADLLNCSTLDEAKEKYPEFREAIDANQLDEKESKGIISNIKNGKVEGANIKTLSLDLLKQHYANAYGHAKKEAYFGLSAKTVLSLFEKLNIKPLNREYFLTITRETPERRAICSQNSLKLWQRDEYRQGRTEDAEKRWQRPEYREKRAASIEKYWSDPENRAMQAENMRKMHNTEGFEEKRIAGIRQAWHDPERKEEFEEINKKCSAARWADSKSREEMSEKMKALWRNPEYRNKVCSGMSERMIKRWMDPKYIELKSKEKTEQWQDPEFRQYMSDVMKEHWQDPEYRKKMAIYSEALKIAWSMHPEISKRMSEIADEFPGLGRVLTKTQEGIELSEDENRLLNAYYKKCHQEMPGFTKTVGQTQQEILKIWKEEDKLAAS